MPNYGPLLENFPDLPTPVECEQTGSIPPWLKGTLLRNGPGVFKYGNTEVNHLFDGHARVERFFFINGKMFYSARNLETTARKAALASNRLICSEFGTARVQDPCKTILQKYFTDFKENEFADNTLVAFTEIGDAVYALTEIPIYTRLDTETLDVKKIWHLRDQFFTVHNATAHQHVDKEGNVYNVGARYGMPSKYVFTKAINPGPAHKDNLEQVPFSVELLGEVDTPLPSYFHSFGLSENYFVLLELPLKLDELAKIGQPGRHFQSLMKWHEGERTNVHVVSRKTGKKLPIKITLEQCFVFHHANTYEKDGFLVVDVCSTERAGELETLMLEAMRKSTSHNALGFDMRLTRCIIPLHGAEEAKVGENLLKNCPFAGDCKATKEADGGIYLTFSDYGIMEFPRYNYNKYNTKPYQFCYGSCDFEKNKTHLDAVVKVDLVNRKRFCWAKDHEDQVIAEPIFLANPSGTTEDDGVVIVPVMTTRAGDHPVVAVLNAKNMSEISRFKIPAERIHFAFHMHYTHN